MNSKRIDALAKSVWDYMKLNQTPTPADCILVFGSNDPRVATYGAELFLRRLAPLILFSGKRGGLTQKWKKTEAEKFAQIAIRAGVPRSKILIEREATNTGENVLFTKRLLEKQGLNPGSFLVVQKPYMERRTWATFKKVWPRKKIIVSSPPISFEDYPNRSISKRDVIAIMLSDLQKIALYPQKGFQIPQRIPKKVLDCYRQLVKLGYTEHLVREKNLRLGPYLLASNSGRQPGIAVSKAAVLAPESNVSTKVTMATKKHNPKQRTRTPKTASKSAVRAKSATKPNPAADAPKLHSSLDPDLPILKLPQAEEAAALDREESQGRSAGQSGSLQGLSDLPSAASESVDELIEEGNSFEAGIVKGVEDAPDADQGEVRTHEVTEDDVPEEYLDNEP
jgi:uncharacterized SAM-binding protein YcdF (DUF218 family)